MRALQWALIQHDWYHYKSMLGHRHTVGIPREHYREMTAIYEAWREGSEETNLSDALIWDF